MPSARLARTLAAHALRPLALLVALAVGAAAQGAPFALETATGSSHTVWLVNETTLAAQPVVGPLNFLSVRLGGYARTERLRRDLAREQSGPPSHVRLPGLGSLYRVRISGETRLMFVRADGSIADLVAVPEVLDEPALLEWISVSRDGSSALVATPLPAGGNVLLLELLPGGGVFDLTAGVPPMDVAGRSLRIGGQRAWFVSGNSVVRVDVSNPPAGTPVEFVSPALAAGDVLHDETAMADDGSALAVVSEDPTGLRLVHLVPLTGPSEQVTALAGPYDLPSLDSAIGPLLAVAPDGGAVAWRQVGPLSNELFVRPTPQAQPTQLTGDSLFVDTIDNVGILGFKDPVSLVFFAGEAGNAAQPIGSADVFAVNATVQGATPVNLSVTSGQQSTPFEPGTLEVFAAYQDPQQDRLLLVTDPVGGDYALLTVATSGTPGVNVLLPDLLVPPELHAVGDSVFILGAPARPSPISHCAHLLNAAGALPAVQVLANVSGTQGIVFDRFSADRGGTRLAFVASAGPGVQLPGLVDASAGSIAAVWPYLFEVGPSLAFSPAGRLSLGVGSPGGPFLHLGFDAPNVGVIYPLPAARGFPLAN